VNDNDLGPGGPDILRDGARSSHAMRKYLLAFQAAISECPWLQRPPSPLTVLLPTAAKPELAPFPIIAATHGHVIGLGVDMTAACDIRIAASNSMFSIKVIYPFACLGT
jgi:Delta3,5-Delta2,4-dienoyl-CoA isomerase